MTDNNNGGDAGQDNGGDAGQQQSQTQTEPKVEQRPGGETKTFAQADVDRIVADRLARERARFADYDELRRKAGQLDELADKQKTDLERAVERARREGGAEAQAVANQRLVRAEARALAASARFRDAADAVAFLNLDGTFVDKDGNVDTAALRSQLDELAKQKPYLLTDSDAVADAARAGIGAGSQTGTGNDVAPGIGRIRNAYSTSTRLR